MKRSIISTLFMAVCIIAISMMSSFKMAPSAPASKTHIFGKGESITIFTTPTSVKGSSYSGSANLSGAINQSGTYVMDVDQSSIAFHGTLEITVPDGTITISMNYSRVSRKGSWKVQGGTDVYQNITGSGNVSKTYYNDDITYNGSVSGL